MKGARFAIIELGIFHEGDKPVGLDQKFGMQ